MKKYRITQTYTSQDIWYEIEAESKEQIIEAWQYLHDTRLAYSLQGWFGRTAQDLIKKGIINE